MFITGTHFNYYIVCKRKLWLFACGMVMEHTSDLVSEGRLLHEESYPQRPEKYEELELDGIKIDFYDVRSKVIHEIKKSDKIEEAHEWQVKYYIHVLERNGLSGVTGLLEYPALRQTAKVLLTDDDREKIRIMEQDISRIAQGELCPDKIHSKICRNCSYYDFCYVGEE